MKKLRLVLFLLYSILFVAEVCLFASGGVRTVGFVMFTISYVLFIVLLLVTRGKR